MRKIKQMDHQLNILLLGEKQPSSDTLFRLRTVVIKYFISAATFNKDLLLLGVDNPSPARSMTAVKN